MANFNKFNSFVADVANKVHNFNSDTFKVALTAAANAPVATNGVLTDLTEISYTFLSSRTLTTSSSSQTGGLYKWIVTDLVITASGGTAATFRYVVIYNDTAGSKQLVGWYDNVTNVTLQDGQTFTLDSDQTAGVIQLQ